MNRRVILVLCFALLWALVPSAVAAQEGNDEGFLLRVSGPVTVRPGETVNLLVAIDADVVVDGNVNGGILAISSDTEINGTVDGDVIAFGGTITLGPDALITGDVSFNDTIYRAEPGAVVQGNLRDDLGVNANRDFARLMAWISLVSWAGTTVLLALTGIVFAGIGQKQLWGSAALITRRPLHSILAALLLWVMLGFLAFMLFVSILGIPVGLALVMVLAAIWGLGYVVAGTRIGAALTGRSPDALPGRKMYLPTLLGIALIQFIALVPVMIALIAAYLTNGSGDEFIPLNALALLVYWSSGAIVWAIGVLGTGALTYSALRSWQGSSTADTTPAGVDATG